MSEYEDFQALISSKARSPLLKTVMSWLRQEKEEDREARLKMGEETPMEIDLKLNTYSADNPFGSNRHANGTMC